MKIYISLPISGRDIEQVEAECVFNAGVIESKGHEAVSPLEVNADIDPTDYDTLMGRCITALLGCDAILMCGDWQDSKGCRLEHRAAVIYGKRIYDRLVQIPKSEKKLGKSLEVVK